MFPGFELNISRPLFSHMASKNYLGRIYCAVYFLAYSRYPYQPCRCISFLEPLEPLYSGSDQVGKDSRNDEGGGEASKQRGERYMTIGGQSIMLLYVLTCPPYC
jgi:hypothetical protein